MRSPTAAEQLLLSLGIDAPRQIDVEAIAWHTGAEVRYAPLESCEARIIGYGNRAIITVDSHSSPARRRFSVGHELGHWRWHRGRSSMCRSDEIGNQRLGASNPERVADNYAADLLMPAFLFAPIANRDPRVTFEAIDEIREEFATSRTATAIRMVDYGPTPALLVCHSQGGRKWFHRSPAIPDRWFPRAEIDAESSAMDVLFGSSDRTRIQLIGADAWFDRYDADRYEVLEQTVRTTDGDTLSLIILRDEEMLE